MKRKKKDDLMATISLKDLAHSIAALTKLAQYVDLDDAGNLHINLPDGASFAVREGNQNRIVIDAGGKVALLGTDILLMDTAGGGQIMTNSEGLHLVAPGSKALLWLHPDGRIQVVGDIQQDVPDA